MSETFEAPHIDGQDGYPPGDGPFDDGPPPRARRRRRWPLRLLYVMAFGLVLVLALGIWLYATRAVLLAAPVAGPARPVIDQTGDWPDAPVNSQYGTVNITYHCSIKAAFLPILSTDMQVAMTGIFPLRVGPGQPFYVTGGKGQAVLPASAVNRLRALGVRQFSGRVTTFDILAVGSTPSLLNAVASAQPIPSTPLVASRPVTIATPTGGRLTIGPFTASGATTEIGVGRVHADLKAVFLKGAKLPGTVSIDCPAPRPTNLVALITVGGAASTTPVRIDGDLQPATLPAGTGLLGAIIPWPCTFTGYGTYTVPTNVNAFVEQLHVAAGQRWAFLNGHGYVSVPPSLLQALAKTNPGATSLEVTLSHLGTIAEDATPADQDYLQAPVTSDPVPLTSGAAAVAHFPRKGTLLEPERFVATSPGTMRIYLGAANGTVQLSGKTGAAVGKPIPFSCPTIRPLMPLLPYVVTP